jgi:type I restriction enzyme S subunit
MKQSWEIKRLDEVCEVEYGTRVVNKRDGGTIYPVYGGGGATFFMDTFNRENCFIVSRFAMSQQCTRFVKGKFFLNDSGLSVKPRNQKEILQHFLNLQLLFLNDHIYSLARGTAQKNLDVPAFRNIEISYPKSLTEQKRIVVILDKAFAAINKAKANAEQNLKNAKEFFESYLQGVFENKGEEWEQKTLGDIGKPSMCKRILKNQTSSTGDIPFYKIGTFGKKPNAFISKEIYNEFRTKYSFPKKGDILISASGTIGRRVRYDGEPAFFQDSNIVWIDNDESQVLNDYLYVFYEFCDWQPSKGATIARLYNSNLTSIKIVFPKSLQEQKNILKKINLLSSEAKRLEANYQQKINDLEELKKSVLQKAFSGELKTEKVIA